MSTPSRVFVARLAGVPSSTPPATRSAGSATRGRCSGRADGRHGCSGWSSRCSQAPDLPADDPGDQHRRGPGHLHRSGQPAALRAAPDRDAGRRRTARPHGDAAWTRASEVTVVDVAHGADAGRDWVISRVAVPKAGQRCAAARRDARSSTGTQVSGLRARRGGPGCGQPARHLRAAAPRRPGQRPARPVAKRRARGRPPRWTTTGSPTSWRSCPRTTRSRSSASSTDERAADVLEEMDPDDAADLLAELPARDRGTAAGADGAGRGRATCGGCCRTQEHTAGGLMTSEPIDPAAGRHGRRRAGPGAQPRPHARRWPRWCTCAGRPLETPTGRTWARSTSSGCCANRRPHWSAGVLDADLEPLRPRRSSWPRSPATWPPTTWSRRPSWTRPARCSAR